MHSRRLLFCAILAAHLVLLVLLGSPAPAPSPPRRHDVLVVAQIAPPTPPRRPPPVVPPTPAPATPVEPPPPPLDPSAPEPPEARDCGTEEAVRAALATDEAKAALVAIPADMRSVANAVMLWDGGWTRAGTAEETGARTALKIAVSAALLKADPACLDQPLAGPRLFAIGEGSDTVALAIGSGRWRWRDLLAPDPAPAPDTPSQASIGSHQVGWRP